MQSYSDYFKTIHDETSPTGTHCSVLRAVVFHDPIGTPLPKGQFADFAVIRDEDRDVRVMKVIEEIYRLGLLSGFRMFGESNGLFTATLSEKITSAIESETRSDGAPGKADGSIVYDEDDDEKIGLYLKNLEKLFQLGLSPADEPPLVFKGQLASMHLS